MSKFEEYYNKHYKVSDDGQVCHIRSGCFNGNGLLESISIGNLEDIYNLGQANNNNNEGVEMNITPPEDKLLVELIKEETIRDSGLIIVQENFKDGGEIHPHSIHKAVVKHVGSEAKYVKKGDNIFLEHCNVRPFVFKGLDYMIIKESDIVGVCNEEK